MSDPLARPPSSGPSLAYVCVVCGGPMHEQACRVRCPRCGYFEDCDNGLTPPPVDSPRRVRAPEEGSRR